MDFRHVTWDEFKERIGGDSLVGYVTTTYNELLRCFGLPNDLFGEAGKVACTWRLIFSDGTGASIYSYGELSSEGHDIPEGLYQWHIGGACTVGVDRWWRSWEQADMNTSQAYLPRRSSSSGDIPFWLGRPGWPFESANIHEPLPLPRTTPN